MTINSVSSLIVALRELRLLEPDQLIELAKLQTGFTNPRDFAKELVKRGWVTPFQINQLFQGHGKNLVLGPYVLMERLGEGGMGEVFKARHQKMGRMVALKLMRKERLANPNAVRRFHRETQAAAKLHHPNIVMAFDADQAGDTHFFVMEYIDGTDLSKLVKQMGPLPVKTACDYIRQAAQGLQHAYEHGMVHRDIKPHNLLLTAPGSGSGKSGTGGVVKILDMGLARLHDADLNDDSRSSLTQENSLMGTPDYISPEQARDAKTADIRSDIYSLGCTLYYLLTGRVPFPEGTLTEKLLKHQLDTPICVETLRSDVSPAIVTVLNKLMAKRPDDRFQTPAQLVEALVAIETTGQLPRAFVPFQANIQTAPARAAVGVMAPAAVAAGDTVSQWSDLQDDTPTDSPPSSRRLAKAPDNKAWLKLYAGGGALLVVGLAVVVAMLSSGKKPKPTDKGDKPGPGSNLPATLKYVKETTRDDTILATLKTNGYPTLEGKWYYLGPFDNSNRDGFETVYPPERGAIDLDGANSGKGGDNITWHEFPDFRVGQVINLALFQRNNQSVIYLYHLIEAKDPFIMPVSLGSDDTLTVWLNGKRLLGINSIRTIVPDQNQVDLDLRAGKNHLLVKVCNQVREWGFYIMPQFPPELVTVYGERFKRDFPSKSGNPPLFRVANSMEGESLGIMDRSGPFDVLPQYATGRRGEWSGGKHLMARPGKKGDWVDLDLQANSAGKYRIFVYLTKARDFGVVQFQINGEPVGKPIDCHAAETSQSGAIELGNADLDRGANRLRITSVAANDNGGLGWGLDCIVLRKIGK